MFVLYLIVGFRLLNLPLPIKACTQCECVHGKHEHSPIMINVGKRQIIAVKGPACPTSVTYTWKAVNSDDTVIYDLRSTSVPRVTWEPYKVSVKPSDAHKNNRIIVTKSDGRTTGRCVCHIDFVFLQLYAHIDGSPIMRIGRKQKLPLRSTKSFDWMSPLGKQQLKYSWECEPAKADMKSSYCVKGETFGTTSSIVVDGSRLDVGEKYKFTLTVTSPSSEMSGKTTVYVHSAWGSVLPVTFVCIRNCDDWLFNAGTAMHLTIDCYFDCGSIRTFVFKIDDVVKDINTNGHFRVMPPDKPEFKFSFALTADGITTEDEGEFIRNDPPVNGACTVTPTSGIPGDTLFAASCNDWHDEQLPLRYTLKAGNLVLDRATDAHWDVYVPDVTELTFIICDARRACTKTNVTITLTKVKVPIGLNEIIEYMKNPGNNIKDLITGGELMRAVVKAILMMNGQPIEADKYILAQFHDFEPTNMVDTLQLGTMINQLMSSLGNITSVNTEAFIELLEKMCEGFKETVASGEIKDMELEELQDVTEEIIDLITKLTTHTEVFGETQSILWEFEGGMIQVADERAEVAPNVGHLIEHYGKFDQMNDTILKPINIRMHALCKTLELMHYIGIASSFRIHKGDEKFKIDTEIVQMVTMGIEKEDNLFLVSPDLQTTAILTKKMLTNMQSHLGGDDMTAQVISFRENPFWWFPTEHPITTTVFYFSSFSEKDHTIEDIPIDIPIKLDMVQQRSTKQPPLIQGAVNATMEMPIYRVRTPAGSAVIINFTTVMVDMDVLVQCKRMPILSEVRASEMHVRAGAKAASRGVQYSDHNHDVKWDWCYVALVASEDAKVAQRSNYTFTVEIYECLTWNVHLDNPTWRTEGCEATHEDENITCTCYHMSVFAGRSYFSTAEEVVRERNVKTQLDINWFLVAFYLLIMLIIIWLLLRAYDDMQKYGGEKLVSDMTESEQQRECAIALHITTGGHWNAATSANVTVTVPSKFIDLITRSYTIAQNPEKPLLKPNTTCVLEIPLRASDLSDPPRIYIKTDGSGRYPTWYCESITIVNLENGKKWHCTVRKWIDGKAVEVQPDKERAAPQNPTAAQKKQLRKEKWQKIKANYHDFFVCWFLFQPLFGPQQHGVAEVNRFVRSCIWIAKFAVIILLVFLWFGPTTLDNYETERYEYEFLIDIIDGKFILFLIGCYLATLLVELLMLLIAYPECVFKCKKASNTDKKPTTSKRLIKKIIYKNKRDPSVAASVSQENNEVTAPTDQNWGGPALDQSRTSDP